MPLPSVAQDPVVKLDVEDEALKVEQQELAKPLGNRPLLASLSKADSNEVLGNSISLGKAKIGLALGSDKPPTYAPTGSPLCDWETEETC